MQTYKTNKTLHGYTNTSILISNPTILPVSLQKPQKMWSPALSRDLKVQVQDVSKPGRWVRLRPPWPFNRWDTENVLYWTDHLDFNSENLLHPTQLPRAEW